MAVMIPTTLTNIPDTTAGERKLFEILRKSLPDTCIVRYEILLGERYRRPDYTLIDPTRGVQIIEVKDWGVASITKASAKQFLVTGMGGNKVPVRLQNPELKCQLYLNDANNQLAAMPSLLDETGRLLIPVIYRIAFPNIGREEFLQAHLDKVVAAERVLFKEDLHLSGTAFRERYEQALPRLKHPLTDEQIKSIAAALLPDTAIPHVTPGIEPAEHGVIEIHKATVDTFNLDIDQEIIAKSLGEGPRLLRGIAGTGKTLIMLYRAKILAANSPKARILILCWNVSLANYMRQVYDRLQFAATGEVSIKHFSEFARELIKGHKGPQYALDDAQFSKLLDKLTIKQVDQFDAVYIDEAQDFRQEWIAFVYHKLLKGDPEKRNLLIAADDAQRIYKARNFRWSDLGIPMVGRSKILRTVYRNSAKVWVFSANLLGRESAGEPIDGGEVSDKLRFASRGGYDPQLIECSTPKEQIKKAIQTVEALIKSGFSLRNVLILYRHKRSHGFDWVGQLQSGLQERNIQFDWIAKDGAKSTFDWSRNSVKISTVHSAKGMDCPVVIVLGAETFRPDVSNGDEDETRLLYVALTRAREFLVVFHTGNGGLIPKLQSSLAQYPSMVSSLP